MYVCVCNAVSDKDIVDAVHNGADDLEAIQSELGASSGCGTCREYTELVINQALAEKLGHAA